MIGQELDLKILKNIMKLINIEISIKESNKVNSNEWINIINLINLFPNDVKRSHELNYYKNKLNKSPYGNSYIVRAMSDKNICLGLLTFTSNSITNDKKIDKAFEMGDAYVHKELEGRMVFSKMMKKGIAFISENYPYSIIYATPNKKSLPWEIRNGFKIIDFNIEQRIMPLNFKNIYKSNFKRILLYPLSKLWILFFKNYLRFFVLKKKCSFFCCKKIDDLPNNFKSNNDIEFKKSKSYLQWRYENNPEKYDIYGLNYNNEFAGYAILKKENFNHMPALYLADIYFDPKYKKYYNAILAKLLLSYELDKFSYISTWISLKSIYWPYLKKILPIKIKDIIFVINKRVAPLNYFVLNNKKIHFVMGDSDNI